VLSTLVLSLLTSRPVEQCFSNDYLLSVDGNQFCIKLLGKEEAAGPWTTL
jgi:hypothetical protein